MYAYVAVKAEQATGARDLAYWRKHPNLHGWMQQLWERKGTPGHAPDDEFNGVELELTWEDIDALEQALIHQQLPPTGGFFFGSNADEVYREADLSFVQAARAELFLGLKVFYNSSW